MADNVVLNAGTGGATIASDDVSSVQHQLVKVEYGVDGSATMVSASNPLPVNASGNAVPVTDNSGSLTVDGTVSISGAVPITDNSGSITVDGTVTVGNTITANAGTGPWPVTDNSGSLTVDGTVTVVQATATNLKVDASGVPVPVTDNGGSLTVDGSVSISGTPAVTVSGTPTVSVSNVVSVIPTASASGGLLKFRSLDLDESEEDVKTSACSVYAMWVTNRATSTRWIKFYNATAASTTVGTTVPEITIGIPGNTTDNVSGHFGTGGVPVYFGTALCVAATTGVADNDTGAPAANDVIVNIFYI